MPVLAAFPDPERVVGAVLADLVGAGSVGRDTGTDLQSRLPFIRVRRIGGADDVVTDHARVDVRVYAAGTTAAKNLSETARQRLISSPHGTVHGVVDKARSETGPVEVPSPDPDNYVVFSTTFRVSLRRRS